MVQYLTVQLQNGCLYLLYAIWYRRYYQMRLDYCWYKFKILKSSVRVSHHSMVSKLSKKKKESYRLFFLSYARFLPLIYTSWYQSADIVHYRA